MEKKKYPEYVLRYLRQRWGMKPDDTSRDEAFQRMESKRVFEEVLIWNGLIGGWGARSLDGLKIFTAWIWRVDYESAKPKCSSS